ncbi:hypothetical protein PCC9214_01426 [Planktothrix tepida]|uniref:Uncharacterized protein n=1 Tax=Planktothrix tepida PCC 9214 TaxID=671072 RepID=A0A1J1LGL7_9CYAN|nr:hypothetical protein [Planktothrix tepida]CAD5933165.1 hypothetical protein PCC9214_01426 [Planktothrix tepida]CUR31717.1 hypothetical protein PL9214291310 [Planktothrix tepida PCC 9214]
MNNNPLIPSMNSQEIPPSDIENLSKNQLKNLMNFPDQTLIKFKDEVSFNLVPPSPEISAPVIQAMQGLVQIIAHLRSPNGSWPSDLPQTPENLIPYVTEEVSELLAAYQTHPISASNIKSDSFPKKDSSIQTPVILFLNTLISQLLWNFAQTSYQFMRLLTGINAEILLPHQDWTPGKLRLVASLIIKTENFQSSIDLATSDSPPTLITSEAYLQSNDCSFCQNPLEVQSFVRQITHHFQDNFQGFNLLNHPIQAEFLSPKSQWEPIEMSIEIGFQFIPDSKTSEVSPFHYFLENAPVDEELFQNTPIQDVEYSILASIPHSALLKTHVRLTDPNIIQPYIQTQIKYYGLHGLQRKKQLQLTNSVNSFLTLDSQTEESELIELIQITDELVDIIYSSKSSSSLIRLQPEIPLIDLSLRLLWQIVKSSYNVMQLMSGIQAKVLQPGFLWQTGTLRLLMVLSAEFLSDSWELDIATSQPLKFDLKPIIPESIIQSDWSELCRSPQSLVVLKLQIINLLETLPELQSWMKGVKIDWGNSNEDLELSPNWQSGLAQLSLDFEWIPAQPGSLE